MEPEYNIGLELKHITDRTRQVGDAVFASFGLTGPQVGYLNYIYRVGGSVAQKELEKVFGVSHPTIVGIVSRLREKGYVNVRTDERDRRSRIVALTEKARKVTLELKKGEEEMDRLLVSGMKREEKEELSRLLRIINDNLDRHMSVTGKKGEQEK